MYRGEMRYRGGHCDLASLSCYNFIAGISLFLCVVVQVQASIHEYKNEAFIPRFNSFFFHGGSEGLYASKVHHTSEDKPLNGKSFIRFESITFRRRKEIADKQNEMQQSTGLVEGILVEVKNRDKIGGAYVNSEAICCTPVLANDGSCKVGEVIIRQDPDNPGWPQRLQTNFEGKSEEAKMVLSTVEINRTGMYYLYFMFCDPELQGTLISGRTVWRNPEGYLPGKMTPLMTFYGLMSLAYLSLDLLWFLRFLQYWKDIIQLHYHITVVIGLGMCEMAFWYFEYANFNATGSRPMGITIWTVTFSAVKKTVSRLLLLVVSMGFSVVRPTLGGITSKVLLLGLVYFVASEALELVEHLGNINDFSGKARVFLVLPVALLDACFILGIFSALSRTLEKLQVRKSLAKPELYRKFTNTLAVSVLVSVAWIGYELYFNASDPLSELWRRAWIIPAFWTVLAFLLLVVICLLWAPSRNPTRYLYSGENDDDVEEEGIALTGTGVKVPGDLAIRACAKKGILLKGGHVFDSLASCYTVAFDKTGTLTMGEFMCKAIEPIHGHLGGNKGENATCCSPNCEKEALIVATAMERGTTHPIGRAVIDHSLGKDLPAVYVESLENLPGRGLYATLSSLSHAKGDVKCCCRITKLPKGIG